MLLFLIIYLLGVAAALPSIKAANKTIVHYWNRFGLGSVWLSWLVVIAALFVIFLDLCDFYLHKYSASAFKKKLTSKINRLRIWCNLPPRG